MVIVSLPTSTLRHRQMAIPHEKYIFGEPEPRMARNGLGCKPLPRSKRSRSSRSLQADTPSVGSDSGGNWRTGQ